jgi:hypothetical protein
MDRLLEISRKEQRREGAVAYLWGHRIRAMGDATQWASR